MTDNAKTGQVQAGRSPEDSAAGGGSVLSTVAQVRRRREAAVRCEPLDCGHRDPLDCAACRQDDEPPRFDPGEIAGLWAEAKMHYFAKDFPEYASDAWRELSPDDPRRLAAALEAAELWRRSQAYERWLDDLDDFEWNAEVFRDARAEAARLARTIGRLRGIREIRDARAKPRPVHVLRATPGWPPIAIPGQPGRHLTYSEERRAA